MRKDVMMLAHFCNDFDEEGNNRFNYLANLLYANEFNVELVTSSFSHNNKREKALMVDQLKFKTTMIQEPGYRKNVSLKRFYSHFIMGKNLKEYLKTRKKPDIIYCAVPSLDVANVAARYALENKIKFIIDIQDLWPEQFKMIFNLPIIGNFFFNPMQKQVNFIYSMADVIIAVSKTYADRALRVNNKCKKANVIFLGTELESFYRMAEKNKVMCKPKDEIWLVYLGTLGHSYDLTCVMDALKILREKEGVVNVKLVIMGDGPLRLKFEDYAKKQGIYTQFWGRLGYGKMVGILTACDIAVNPISLGAAQSIINKHGDYAAAGLPVLNTQECQEYRTMVEQYHMGVNCKNNNPADLADKLLKLCKDEKLRKTMGENSRILAVEKFDRKKTYQRIVNIINNSIMIGEGKIFDRSN